MENSDAKLEEPLVVTEFRKSYNEDVKSGLSEVKKQFPEQRDLIDIITIILTEPLDLSDREQISRLAETVKKVNVAYLEEPELGKGIGEVLASAILANIQKFNIFQQLAEYLHSVGGRKIILSNPIDTVHVKAGKSSLHFSVDYTDLAQGYYPPIIVETTVRSEKARAFPLFKLFKWAEK